MNPQKKALPGDALRAWRLSLWLILFGGMMFFWPACLDRYLVPRFFFLSAALIAAFFLVWNDLRDRGDWQLRGFDVLLLGWYGLNLASVSWAFNWSEGIFYAQKTLLLFFVYWFSRQALHRDETMARGTLRQIVTLMSWTVCGIMAVQVGLAFSQHGLDNEKLYEYASGLFGNKSLATDFLFFLLVFNVLLYREQPRSSDFWVTAGLIGALILLLQTRTVYLAMAICTALYCLLRAVMEPGFRPLFFRKILPATCILVVLLAAALALKGRGNSLPERLNPFTYLESGSANERRFVWYKTDVLNRDHFWLGVGDGSWKIWFPSKNIAGGYRLEEKGVVFTRAHNDYLEIRSEMGIVGVVWFCTLFGVAFLAAIRALYKNAGNALVQHDLLVAALGLLGYCIIQFFDFPRERIDLQIVLALLFAWILFYSRNTLPRFMTADVYAKPLVVALAGAGLSFNLLIGWYRIDGEIHNVRMAEAQEKGNWKALAYEAAAAENKFYQYTDVAIPLAWHEGIAKYQLGQTEQAVAAFEKAYRLHPWSFQVMNNYASALVKHKQYRASIPLYEQALNINPSFDDGKLNLSFVYFQLGEYAKSMEWLNRVDTIANPANAEDREKNRLVKLRQSEFQKAIREKMK